MLDSFTDLTAAPPAIWSADDERLECVQVRDETYDVRTFVLRAVEPRTFRYRPGQYMTYTLPVDAQAGAEIRRCYTISTTPTRPDTLSITVKRVPGGPASNWLHDHLQPGMTLAAQGPYGEFSCYITSEQKTPLLFLSAGSGITPLMSMARAFHDLGRDVDLTFVHAARTPADIIFAEELSMMARNLPHFNLAVVCEQRGRASTYAGMLGRVTLLLLQSQVADFVDRDIYCCGPAPFMEAMRTLLQAAGYDMRRYREESFNFETLLDNTPQVGPLAPDAVAPPVTASYEVRFAKRGDVFRCAADHTILQAAQAAGLRVPFSCAQGICGTCRTVKVSGTVEMNDNGGLRPREIKQGWILPCCSKPTSDVVLDR